MGGLNLPLLAVRVAERFSAVRVMGLAAEMTYYVILSTFPIIGALGAGLGFLFSLGAVVTVTLLLALVVVGPLLGGAQAIAAWLGMDRVFETLWALLQWPVVVGVCMAFLSTLYRFGPNVSNRWRDVFPGAVFGVAGAIGVTVGFRMYIRVVGADGPTIPDAEQLVGVSAQVIGAGLASLLWVWLTSIVVLTGGVLNAEVSRMKAGAGTPREDR